MTTTIPEMSIGYQQVVEALGDAVVICNRHGVITFWNAAAERLFGFTLADALGNSLDLIIPERLQERHWVGFTRTMATGQTRYQHDVLRVPAMHKDGRTLSIAITVGLLLGTQRTVTGIVADSRRNQTLRGRARFAQAISRTRRETRRVSATNNTGS
jgi:PAS domain S-box-containing protein